MKVYIVTEYDSLYESDRTVAVYANESEANAVAAIIEEEDKRVSAYVEEFEVIM